MSFQKKEGIPKHVSSSELEQWATRALLLKVKVPFKRAVHSYQQSGKDLVVSSLPLTSLLLIDEETVEYLVNTWKWSALPTSSSSSSSDGDSYGGDSGGGGDGGGAD
ncbi:hypothetical protein [Metabacillus herbersteinensis]|uniref:hypothetical protein n=1 Tax=Metabacillus herbersteinensis TaxID=283816 RepID=UPI00366AF341